jgi:hypothetical protein
MNTWPEGKRRAMTQSEHAAWNASNYPSTLQICCKCDDPTGRCEEDAIYTDEGDGPFCQGCYHKTEEYLLSEA